MGVSLRQRPAGSGQWWVFANKKGKIFGRVPFENALHRCLSAAGLRRIRIHDLRDIPMQQFGF